jgi:anti-sigma regulatory factor (Ser/Thr protein kinase)
VPTAVLRLPPLAEQVRTARLVAAAAARRLGLDEEGQDEVRLAVGEAAARAVLRHNRAGVGADVVVTLVDDDGSFVVEVRDAVTAQPAPAAAAGAAPRPDTEATPPGADVLDDDLALALVQALADRAEVADDPAGQRVRLTWDVPGA